MARASMSILGYPAGAAYDELLDASRKPQPGDTALFNWLSGYRKFKPPFCINTTVSAFAQPVNFASCSFLHARVRLTCEYQFAQTQQSHVNPLL